MMRGMAKAFLTIVAVLVLLPAAAYAQEGQIAGTVRDASGAVMPGVTVEASSPALIEKVRTAQTDANGQYRLTNLPVGTYKVVFSLEGFTKQERDNVALTSGFTAPVNATMSVGQLNETVVVSGAAPIVDIQNAREVVSFTGEQIKDLPTSRNVNSLLQLTPGISSLYKPTTQFGAPGVCVGGIGVFCNPGVSGFNVGDTDGTNLNQGRVMVDGQVVNQGGSLPLGGVTGGYTADIANSQEVNIQVSGALGESETGGSSINIVPRTGGNRFTGNFNTTFTNENLFSANNGAFPNINSVLQAVKSDRDISMGVGGPIMRDKLWFYSVGRDQRIHKLPVGIDFWPNKWEGQYGYNYQPDRDKPRVEYKNMWRSLNARITWQASQKNKFGFYWDEQDFCQDPCLGVVSVFTSPESWWSVAIKPDRLQQVNWTNPMTNKVLLEAGLNFSQQYYHTDEHREYENPVDIPRVVETGDTAGGDEVASRVNQFAGLPGLFALTSGSLNSALAAGGAEVRDTKNYRLRGSMSYVTGRHHAKFGYDGAIFTQAQTNKVNNVQMQFNYTTPAVTCVPGAATGNCGNVSLQFPSDPFNTARHPIPASVTFNTGSGTVNDKVWYTAFYAQDQWSLRRLTLSGALRFDNARSGYGVTCVGPNYLVPVQSNGDNKYCTQPADGVNYRDLTPRYGATYDLFGNGRTAIKINGGKFLNAAGITGVYSGTNPARRTSNQLTRTWTDANNNRRVDCNILDATDTRDGCGAFSFGSNTAQYGRDPNALDAAGIPVGLTTTQCGRTESAIPGAVQAYCNAYGESIVDGWDRRRNEWQFGIGIQHEILPRLSGEFTYNRRQYYNITVSDQLNIGCDRFNGTVDVRTCQDNMLKYSNPSYDFYSVVAPSDPRLPNGGGYRILGLNDVAATLPPNQPTAQTYMNTLNYKWNGFDTQFAWRAPYGIRVQGGTSTSRTQRNTCYSELDGPNVRGREGAEWQAGCDTRTPFQTTIRGSATYNVPWVDVLVSGVFQSLPGTDIGANLTYSKDQLQWNAASATRATTPCSNVANGVGCLGGTRNTTTVSVPLLLSNEMYGERVAYWDMKFAKNIRFSGKRAQIGVDVYNIFNSDAIVAYNGNYVVDNPATPAVEVNTWLDPQTLISPRYIRFQVQFDF